MTEPKTHIDVRDPAAMRALANPLRLRLLGLLRRGGPHSVGQLSTLADAAPGSVSYHLATLARFGFVEEAPELARDARERWWRASHDMTRFEPSAYLADPESAAAGRAMRASFAQSHLAEELAYLDAESETPIEWVRSATSGDIGAYLTPDQLRELSDAVEKLAETWNISEESAAPGARHVRFFYSTFLQA